MQHFDYYALHHFTEKVFLSMGCPAEDARLSADVLLLADLRGVDSHGVARLAGYTRLWDSKRINTHPSITIVHETPSTAVIDGDAGLGLVVAPFAMQIAQEKAEYAGTGWVSVRNSNHFGIAGYHAMQPLDKDMVGIAMTNASPLVAPTFSTERLLGTNPIAVAIPAGKEPPFVADFATTTAANGKLEILQRKNESAPYGWVQDAEGNSSTNPKEVSEGGALLPLGGDREHGSHKGYSLSAMVDIFSAIFSGANYGPWVPPFVSFLPLAPEPVGLGIGHFLGAMRVDAFRPVDDFKQHMDHWIRRFRQAKTSAGHEKVLIPGDPERQMERERREKGIPLLEPVIKDLEEVGERFGLSLKG